MSTLQEQADAARDRQEKEQDCTEGKYLKFT
jgi:hypothetical protein